MRSLLVIVGILGTPVFAWAQDPSAKTGRSPFGDPQNQPPLGPSLLPPLPGPAATSPESAPEPPEPSPGELRMRIAEGLGAAAQAGYPMSEVGEDEFVYEDERFWINIHRDGSFDHDSVPTWFWLDGSTPGHDVYSLEKQRILEATFEMRFAMAQRDARERMARALAELPGYLEWIGRDLRRPERERRRLLGELADECDPSSAGGRQARAIIEHYLAAPL
jgi:hypothetical protein